MMRVSISFVLLLLSSVPAYSAQSVGEKVSRALEYDCAQHPTLELPRAGLKLGLVDQTSRPDKQNVSLLGAAACEATSAAMRAAAKEHRGAAWMDGLTFRLVDKIGGMPDQAFFKRDILGEYPRSITVASGLLNRRLKQEFLFVLGHELAHGVYFDHEKKAGVRVAGELALAFGFGYAGLGKGALRRTAAAAVGAGGLALAACGPGQLNIRNEMKADTFALQVMAEAGMSAAAAKATAIELMASHREKEPGCITRADGTLGLPDGDRHPGTEKRIEAISNFSAPD